MTRRQDSADTGYRFPPFLQGPPHREELAFPASLRLPSLRRDGQMSFAQSVHSLQAGHLCGMSTRIWQRGAGAGGQHHERRCPT